MTLSQMSLNQVAIYRDHLPKQIHTRKWDLEVREFDNVWSLTTTSGYEILINTVCQTKRYQFDVKIFGT